MTTVARPPRTARRVAAVLSALVLTLLNALLAYLTLVQLMPYSGSHERDAAEKFAVISSLALGWAALVLLLTTVPVRLHWLRRWWYGPPLLLGALLLARRLLFAPYG